MLMRTGDDVPGSKDNGKRLAELNAYCKKEWCLGDDTDENIFVTPINTCDVDVTDKLDVAVEGASEELKELCLFNERCITDAIVSGDSTVGVRTMETEEKQDEHVVVTTRNEEDGQEADVIGDVPIERFTGAKVCKQFGDFDFGWSMGKLVVGRLSSYTYQLHYLYSLEFVCLFILHRRMLPRPGRRI